MMRTISGRTAGAHRAFQDRQRAIRPCVSLQPFNSNASLIRSPCFCFCFLAGTAAGAEKNADMMLTGDELADFYAELSRKFPIVTIEDPFDQARHLLFSLIAQELYIKWICGAGTDLFGEQTPHEISAGVFSILKINSKLTIKKM